MSGILMKNLDLDAGQFVSVRAMHIYDVYEYHRHISGMGRLGVGIISKGQDLLVPPCEYERDLCCYVNGAPFWQNSGCPHIKFAANGQLMEHYGLAIIHKQNGDQFEPRGHYVSTVVRSTDKFTGRDYETYDTQLHRGEGVAGIYEYGSTIPAYEEVPHGSYFFFDVNNVIAPTYTALVALDNISIKGLGLVHLSYVPDYDNSFSFSGYIDGDLDNGPRGLNWYTYRYRNLPSGQIHDTPVVMARPLNKYVTIDGETLGLYAVTFDHQFGGSFDGNTWKYFECPYIHIVRADTTKTGTLYVLDECITIHKPVLD